MLAVRLLFLVLEGVGLYATSFHRLRQTYEAGEQRPQPCQLGNRGPRRCIAVTRGCSEGHGSVPAGSTAVDAPMIGTLRAPTLTLPGVGGMHADSDGTRTPHCSIASGGKPLSLSRPGRTTTWTIRTCAGREHRDEICRITRRGRPRDRRRDWPRPAGFRRD